MGVDGDFNELSTVRFQSRMKPAALAIYRSLFAGCVLEDLRECGVKVHILDKEFGIDSLLRLPASQNWISLQEKYRQHHYLRYHQFTQEYKNAAGTPHESDGEWFKLGAQLYFYGWANETCTDFSDWIILDIAKYKALVEKAGGLAAVGQLMKNKSFGRATFYCINIDAIESAVIYRKAFEAQRPALVFSGAQATFAFT